MSPPDDDAAIVAAMVRDFDFPRYAAALFAPPASRRAMLALAAFALEITRIPDQVSQPLPGEVRLQWWTDAIEGTEHGGAAGHPVAAELLRAVETHALPRAPLLTLIEAHKFDLYEDPMPAMAALDVYCDDTVGSLIGANVTLLSKNEAPVDDTIRDAGRALGLARFLSRLPHDAAHRRCFLPDDAMTAHGVTRHNVLAGEETPGLRALRYEFIEKAGVHLRNAIAALNNSSPEIRAAFLPLATLQHELDALSRHPSFALVPPSSRLRVLISQKWMMR